MLVLVMDMVLQLTNELMRWNAPKNKNVYAYIKFIYYIVYIT